MKVEKLVTLGCIVFPRAFCLLGALCTLDGLEVPAKTSCCEASGKCWEPPIKLWVCAPSVVRAPESALKDSDSGR